MIKTYLFNIARAVDRLVNALTGGDPEMTISGRMGLAVQMGRCRICSLICRLLDKIQPGHCAKQAAREKDEGGDEVIKL